MKICFLSIFVALMSSQIALGLSFMDQDGNDPWFPSCVATWASNNCAPNGGAAIRNTDQCYFNPQSGHWELHERIVNDNGTPAIPGVCTVGGPGTGVATGTAVHDCQTLCDNLPIPTTPPGGPTPTTTPRKFTGVCFSTGIVFCDTKKKLLGIAPVFKFYKRQIYFAF